MNNLTPQEGVKRQPVGNLIDFTLPIDGVPNLDIEVTANDEGRVVIFHNLPFVEELAQLEFTTATGDLEFILDSGDKRSFGFPLKPELAKNMHNTYQVLMVLMDNETGQPVKGTFKPLLIG